MCMSNEGHIKRLGQAFSKASGQDKLNAKGHPWYDIGLKTTKPWNNVSLIDFYLKQNGEAG